MGLLSAEDREYLAKELEERLQGEVILHFFADGNREASITTGQILEELEPLHELLMVKRYDFHRERAAAEGLQVDKAPAIVLARPDKIYGIRFFGTPAGYEFDSLVEGIIDVSRGEADLPWEIVKELEELDSEVHIQVFVTPMCPYCPRAVRTAHKFALVSEHVTADMVMATDFEELTARYGISAVPHMVVNERVSFVGALPEHQFLREVLKSVGVR